MPTPDIAAPDGLILVLNCGSSSIKYALFDPVVQPLPRQPMWQGQIGGIGAALGYHDALARLRDEVALELRRLGGRPLRAVAHRVVHGGGRYREPVQVDAAVLAELRRFIPLAPLHQPFALEALEILLADHPGLPQVACFDTAFHHDLPMVEQMLPLDWQAWQDGLRRYGFHGLSYEYLSAALIERHGGVARGRVIVAHLGSGASLCALQGGRSVATTMGFSALDGLMMGSRCGSLDPGALIHLMHTRGLDADALSDLLYRGSGLLGLSGLSPDPRVLLAAECGGGPEAAQAGAALALYVRRVVREIGALTAVLGGLDLLAFSAGIGEHSAEIRQRVCADLGFLGAQLDPAANQANMPVISTTASSLPVVVEATNEEWIAAQWVLAIT